MLRRSWPIVPVVLLGSCLLPGILLWVIDLMAPHFGWERVIPFDWLDGAANGIGALAWVALGAGLAPRHRRALSLGLFVLGASIANLMLGPWTYPENHVRAYQPSVVPLRLTLACGVAGVVLVWWNERQGWGSTVNGAPARLGMSGEAP
jgi:hypothetical protein